MNKTKSVSGFLSAALSVGALNAAQVSAEGVDGYIGAGAGYFNHDINDREFDLRTKDNSSGAWQVFGGLDFADYFGAEVYYSDLGNTRFKSIAGSVDYAAYGASFLGYWPMNHNDWALYARIGIAGIEQEGQNLPIKKSVHTRASGGIGVRWNFNPNWFTRFEIDTYGSDHQGAFLSLAYHFGNGTAKKAAVQAQPTVTEVAEPQQQQVSDAAEKTSNDMNKEINKELDKTAAAATAATTAAVVVTAETMDTDGDGIVDAKDNCGKTPAGITVDETGCASFQGSFEGVQFESGSSTLKPSSYEELDEIAAALNLYPNVKLAVAAHSDASGAADANLNLSQKRAESVVAYLQGKGVESERMEAKGFGEEQPIASNDNAEGRAKNRRVEFTVEQREL
ncbi:Outer membrane porin F [BD1-7 clade bacterium]|uniref:Outer membrane porin F n=1 Tax=BD1-7 clade bacterium TaxID=2029982 RepID=A0A5S9QQH0_9GAMM|nr:Outer membrane porin F [BD1-7 clade bacterium]CAA0121627.1 Outer membrane porin F [BD1-7 clade bacterium]